MSSNDDMEARIKILDSTILLVEGLAEMEFSQEEGAIWINILAAADALKVARTQYREWEDDGRPLAATLDQ
jgi:hypothetical protein